MSSNKQRITWKLPAILMGIGFMACTPTNPEITWKQLAPLPPTAGKIHQPGLAGALCGVSNNCLIVAGGANFEDGLPWEGATKVYHDDVFVLSEGDDHQWIEHQAKLPQAMGYSACIETGKGIFCTGGENAAGVMDQTMLMEYSGGEIHFLPLAPIPEALSSAAIATIGKTIYVAGGLGHQGAVNSFYAYNLTQDQWQRMPSLPTPLSHALLVAQNDGEETALFLLGGRCKTGELTTFYNQIWKYRPSESKWVAAGNISVEGNKMGWAAGTALPYGNQTILLFGGDDGILYNKTENLLNLISGAGSKEKQDELTKQKNLHLSTHPGFNRSIMEYNTRTGKLTLIGLYPTDAQVTTRAILWNGKVIIPSGEIRPGIRTPQVWMGKIRSN